MSRTIHINVFGLIFFILIVISGYASFKLWPLYVKRQDLEVIVKDLAYKLKRNDAQRVKEAVAQRAKKELDIDIPLSSIYLEKYDSFVRIRVVWAPEIDVLGGKRVAWPMEVSQKIGVLE